MVRRAKSTIVRYISTFVRYITRWHTTHTEAKLVGLRKAEFFLTLQAPRGSKKRGVLLSPPPKNIEQNILGYVDCLKFCSLLLRIAQFNNNKRPPHNTSTTRNNNQSEPPLPYPWQLCPLIPWACQQRPQRMAPRLPMAPRKVPVIGFGRAMVGSLVGGEK